MSAFEQKREIPNRALQYMVVRLSFYPCLLPPPVSHLDPSLTPVFYTRTLCQTRHSHQSTRANRQLAAEPYETISFAIPSKDMVDDDEDPEATWEHWDADEKVYSCQLLFK